jgi:hypothetical protein
MGPTLDGILAHNTGLCVFQIGDFVLVFGATISTVRGLLSVSGN